MIDTGWQNPLNAVSLTWIKPKNISLSDNKYTTSNTVTNQLIAREYNLSGLATTGGHYRIITKIEVRLEGRIAGLSGLLSATLSVQLSWNMGFNWTDEGTQTWNTTIDTYKIFRAPLGGEVGNQRTWGRHWSPNEIENANFRTRITVISLIGAGTTINADNMQVKVHYLDIRHIGGGGAIIMDERRIVLMQ